MFHYLQFILIFFTDSQCLSKKCFSYYCVFNGETLVVHCDDIYFLPGLFKKEAHICIYVL